MLWPLLQVLRHQKMHDFGVQQCTHGLIHARVSGRVLAFSSTTREHGQDTRPCSIVVLENASTRPCIMAVFSTASKFWKINFELLLGFSHIRCIWDNILTYYAWINHLEDLQMLYLIKWLNGLLIDEICKSCILNEYACHSCKVDFWA